MKNEILSKVVKLASAFRMEWVSDLANGRPELDASGVAALKVAMMVSALDGNVTAEEFKAFEKLAHFVPGCRPERVAELLDGCLRSAGYIELQAKRLGAKALVDVFVREAEDALPGDFLSDDLVRMRRAFVIWIAMAMADGDYSPVERQCILALRDKLDAVVRDADASDDFAWRRLSPAFAIGYLASRRSREPRKAPGDDFMTTAERLIAELADPARCREALKGLKALVAGA